ncbi:T9SS type A sorting domain-containing protein [Brumimicrobium aurantiacum]|uniref:DUF4465 domain-containing protein n=1 Tax=Brumimicrobium aurantiacum TaxID=1737063 RepID=A0A3E1EXK8_9FLAO|nr:DUF4465 domain-containing protein [Brumimicrobium aurantiacum]RFC54295.1 DUF4465 domain-containing protein [Brumimicrobium aurantiacum]
MKKIYFLASALLAVTTLKAQTTVDFEDLTLDPESYYNGSDEAGGFTSGGVTFENEYNTAWGSWNGFSYSNITDNTTTGYGNQYSAIPGSGADNSEIYAVYHSGDTMHFPDSHARISSIDITNTTYAYYSMKDGDAFAKEFGSPNDASGADDGTNGEDFFNIVIYNHDATGAKTDSITFYLADFRFSDDNDDYIIDTWTPVDLTAFTDINYLTFSFNSSDVGEFGLNTPTYFALDNIKYENTTGLTKNEIAQFSLYPNPATSTLNISGDAGEYKIFNTNGSIVKSFTHNGLSTIDISSLNSGIYIVKVSTGNSFGTQKLIIR